MKSYSFTTLLLLFTFSHFAAFSQTIGGIGAQLKLDSSGGHTIPLIQKLIPGSPAAATLKENLFIIKVDDNECKDKTLEQIVGWIRGNVGTAVRMTIADNRAGKQSKEYTLTRAAIAAPPNNPGADPVTAFFAACEAEVKQMKRKGTTIVKTFNSECGNFFFNFDAESGPYNVRTLILQDKQTTDKSKASILVFDNNDEKNPVILGNAQLKPDNSSITELSGTITFRRETVGTIAIQLNDDSKKCQAIYIVVSK